jgi:nucleotide-binding universal stress UspA family protein
MRPSILVPLDGSPLAASALLHASRLAQALRARVVLFYARDRNDADHGPDLRASIELLRAGGVAVETREAPILGSAMAGHAIAKMAAGLDHSVIVMSTHGRGGLGRLILGSTADQVVRHSTAPVLLIPDGCRTAWPSDRPLRILVPLNGSEAAERVLGPVTDLADALHATLHLLRVVRIPDRSMYNYSLVFLKFDPEREMTEARAYLAGIAERLRTTERMVTTRAMTGTPYFAVADVARELDADLIAMGSHGRGGLDRQVMGSVATDTIRRARRPTLLIGQAVKVESSLKGHGLASSDGGGSGASPQ